MPGIIFPDFPDKSINREIFEAGGKAYMLSHVLIAGAFRGAIQGFLSNCRDRLACSLYAEEEGFEIQPDELQLSYDMFRYQHSLFSVEDTIKWLCDRGLQEEDLVRYVQRDKWHTRFEHMLDQTRKAYVPPISSFAMVLWPEFVLTGFLKSLTIPFAWRLMASLEAFPEEESVDEVRSSFTQRALSEIGSVESWLEHYGCSPVWLDELVAIEASFIMLRREVLSPDHCRKVLENKKIDFMRFVFESALFPSSEPAKEAYQCIVQDGETFEAVLKRIGVTKEHHSLLLEDIPEPLSLLLLSRSPGDVFLTADEDGDHVLYNVAKRSRPGLEDPVVRERVESILLSRKFGPLVERGIRFLVPMD